MKNGDELNFEFAPTGGGDFTGANDPISTTFKNIASTLARESIQNATDAKDPLSQKPARVEFQLITHQVSDIPNFDRLKSTLAACREVCGDDIDKAKSLTTAIKKIEDNSYLNILKISDYNTTGLTGSDEDKRGNYFLLMKTIGGTSKSGGAGGSFGFGKGAYHAASAFEAFFMSSVFGENDYVFQGKIRLPSFDDKDRGEMQGNGSYGLAGQKAVRDKALIPKLFLREEQGTDIYIIDFLDHDRDWKKNMIKTILNSFWCSIVNDKLEVEVGKEEITSANIDDYLQKFYDPDEPDKKDEPNPLPYYLAYTNYDHCLSGDLESIGKVQLFVKFDENYPNKVTYIRQTGMVIEKKPTGAVSECAAVFVCEDKLGNEILREMENPEHDEWDKNNAKRTRFEKEAEAADREIRKFLKDSFDSLSTTDTTKASPIPGLEKYLNLPGEEDSDTSYQNTSGKPLNEASEQETGGELGITQQFPVTPSVKQVRVVNEYVTQGDSGGTDTIFRGQNGDRTGIARGHEDLDKDKKVKVLRDIKYRTFAVRNNNGRTEHVLIIKGSKGTECSVEVKAGTDDSFDTVNIEKAEDPNGRLYQTEGNTIQGVVLGENKEIKLRLFFSGQDKYSLNITAYENK